MGRYPPVRLVMPEGINSDDMPSATKDNAIKPNKQIDIDTQLPIGTSCSERITLQSIILHAISVERSAPGSGRCRAVGARHWALNSRHFAIKTVRSKIPKTVCRKMRGEKFSNLSSANFFSPHIFRQQSCPSFRYQEVSHRCIPSVGGTGRAWGNRT